MSSSATPAFVPTRSNDGGRGWVAGSTNMRFSPAPLSATSARERSFGSRLLRNWTASPSDISDQRQAQYAIGFAVFRIEEARELEHVAIVFDHPGQFDPAVPAPEQILDHAMEHGHV